MSTTAIDLTELRNIANAATPGEWWTRQFEPNVSDIFASDGSGDNPGVAEVWHPEDAAHIVAFDPPTVLALLDRVEAANDAPRDPVGFVIVDIKTRKLDWDGEMHPTREAAIDSLTAGRTWWCRAPEEATDERTYYGEVYEILAVTK